MQQLSKSRRHRLVNLMAGNAFEHMISELDWFRHYDEGWLDLDLTAIEKAALLNDAVNLLGRILKGGPFTKEERRVMATDIHDVDNDCEDFSA
jgi:hypothetical protein